MRKISTLIVCILTTITCVIASEPAANVVMAQKPYVSTWMSFKHWRKAFEEIYGKTMPVAEIMQGLADAGVTDLYFTHQARPGDFFDRHSRFQSNQISADENYDLLDEVLAAAEQQQMKVWLAQTPKRMEEEYITEQLEPVYPGIRLNLINSGLRQYFYDMIDSVAANYGKYNSLAGFSWHEVNDVSRFQLYRRDPDLIAGFKRFAKERYQTEYADEDIPPVQAENVWWRRFYRYHMHVMNDFIHDMAQRAEKHNLRSDFCFYIPESDNRESWTWAYDILALEQIVDQIWFVGRREDGKFYQSIRGGVADFGPSYSGQNLLNNFSYTFHGLPLGFWEGKRPLWVNLQDAYTSTQKGVDLCFGKDQFPQWLELMTAWQGGTSPAHAALAINPTPFIMHHPNAPGIEYRAKVTDLLQALNRYIDIDGMITGSQAMPENLKTYRCVILPEDMSVGLDPESYKRYHDFVKNGGTLLVINSPVTITRDDLTEVQDKTAELCGVRLQKKNIPGYVALESDTLTVPAKKFWGSVFEIEPAGAEVLARRKHTGEPIITRYKQGRGAVYFSAVSAHPDAAAFFADIINHAARCPIRLQSSTGITIRESVRKDNLLAVTLWGKGTGMLQVDVQALGIDGSVFQARDAVTGQIISDKIEADQLAQGLPIEIEYADQLLLLVIGPAAATAQFTGILESPEVFKDLDQQTIRMIENPEVPINVPPGDGVRIGVYYNGLGAVPIIATLKAQNYRVFTLPRLDAHSFKHADIIIIPQLRGKKYALFIQAIDELRDHVNAGGGVLLTHDAVGYRKHDPAFPEIGQGYLNPVSLEILDQVTVIEKHPVTEGFEVGDTFTHAYYDHVTLTGNTQGTTLIKDERDMPALVVGEFGKGRVVLNGMLPGYASVERTQAEEREPEGGELQILLNAIKWLSGDKK